MDKNNFLNRIFNSIQRIEDSRKKTISETESKQAEFRKQFLAKKKHADSILHSSSFHDFDTK